MAADETIAVLGAGGTMGRAMAYNLLRARFEVRAWNRSREKAEPLERDGARLHDSPAEAAEGATVILTMLTDGDAVHEAIENALEANLGEEPVWVQMSTIGEEATERCAVLARRHDVDFVDAPVSGTKEPAEHGALEIFASGPERLRDRLDPLFDAVGKRTVWVGDAGGGTRLKLVVNAWLTAVVEGAAETLALAQGLELDPQVVLDAVKDGPLDSPFLQMKGTAMIEGSFEPSFRLALAAKDAALVQESAHRRGLELPLLDVIRDRLQEGVPDNGDKDVAATYLTSARERA